MSSIEPAADIRVLVVDDSKAIRAIVRGQLESRGHIVIDNSNGADALERCLKEQPDVMILDIEMPGLDGRAVLAAMQENEELARIPVIFLSGRGELDDVVAGLDAGAHDYLIKPFKPGELIARVRVAARVKRLADDLRLNNAELASLSRTDTLTTLPNRRHLEERLRSLISESTRHGHHVGVVLIDVDKFKVINDTIGHPAGDDVLREVARRLQKSLRLEDMVGRWGGEEFLALLTRADHNGCREAAERLRLAVASSRVQVDGHGAIPVTISAGCAVVAGGEYEDVLRRVDVALYAAKQNGRNQVCMDDATSPLP